MATSGSITKTTAFGNIKMTMTRTSVDITNNCSYWTATLTRYASSNISSSANKTGSMIVNGVTVWSGNITIGGSGTKTLKTVTGIRIPHNADGTKTFNFSFSQKIEITWSGKWIGTVSGSGSVTVDTIPRASSFGTVSGNTIGSSITVNISRHSSSFTHSLWYSFGGLTWQGIASGIGTQTTFTPPLSICSQIPNGMSGTLTLILRTYNGSTQIGSDVTKTITVNVPSSVVPTISSIGVSEATANIASRFGAYVKDKTTLNITVNASGAYGSTIRNYETTIQGIKYTSQSFKSNVINASGSVTISSKITDSRGRTASKSVTINVLDYYTPQANNLTVQRCLSNGTLDDDGTYVKCTLSFNIAPVNNKNTKSVKLQWLNGSTWTDLITYTDVYSVTNRVYITTKEFDTGNSFEIRLYVSDFFVGIPLQKTIPTAFTLINYNHSGKGIAFGKVSEQDNTLDVGMDGKFRKTLSVLGMTTLSNNLSVGGILSVTGGVAGQLTRSHTGGSWIQGRNTAMIRNGGYSTGAFCGMVAMATPAGYWTMGTLGENLYFSYTTDANYNAGNNASVAPYIGNDGKFHGGASYANDLDGGYGNRTKVYSSLEINTRGMIDEVGPASSGTLSVPQIGNGTGDYVKNLYLLAGNSSTSETGYVCIGNKQNRLYFEPVFSNSSYNAFFRARDNGKCCLGTSSRRWYCVYTANSVNVSSDRRLKENIKYFDDNSYGEIYEQVFNNLKATSFTMKSDDKRRIRLGFIAQDVREAINDIGLDIKDVDFITRGMNDEEEEDENNMLGLAYEQFIPIVTYMLQKCLKQVEDQEKEIKKIRKEVFK